MGALVDYQENDVYEEIITCLKRLDMVNREVFSKMYRYFKQEENLNNLSEDQKCFLAAALMQVDVSLPEIKKHNCAGKKGVLKAYYEEHIDNCSKETIEEIRKFQDDKLKRKIELRRFREEKELMDEYPEVYKELLSYRREKEKVLVKHE